MEASKCCCTCEHWEYDDSLRSKALENRYGEGHAYCSYRNEITFCDKHNCIAYSPKSEGVGLND